MGHMGVYFHVFVFVSSYTVCITILQIIRLRVRVTFPSFPQFQGRIQNKLAPVMFWITLAKPLTLTSQTLWVMLAVYMSRSPKKPHWDINHRIFCVKSTGRLGLLLPYIQGEFQLFFLSTIIFKTNSPNRQKRTFIYFWQKNCR